MMPHLNMYLLKFQRRNIKTNPILNVFEAIYSPFYRLRVPPHPHVNSILTENNKWDKYYLASAERRRATSLAPRMKNHPQMDCC